MKEGIETIIGISLGTRTSGIAVLENEGLAEWATFSFKGVWSPHKKAAIIGKLVSFCRLHGATKVAIKTPNAIYLSKAFMELLTTLTEKLQKNGIAISLHTINELKEYCFPTAAANKALLAQYIGRKYPEIYCTTRKEAVNRNRYHVKMFEAILVAEMQKG